MIGVDFVKSLSGVAVAHENSPVDARGMRFSEDAIYARTEASRIRARTFAGRRDCARFGVGRGLSTGGVRQNKASPNAKHGREPAQ